MEIETIKAIGLYWVIPVCAVLWALILVIGANDDRID